MAKKHRPFHFKKFSIDHSESTMKVGTDGVLLGAWVAVEGCTSILDIGTGSGVIALMLAQRSAEGTVIDAIEINERDAKVAEGNVFASPWPHKVTIHCIAAQKFESQRRYDLIVSNPPYFSNSFEPPDPSRLLARHTSSLTFDDLIDVALRCMSAEGRLAVVLPFTEGLHFTELAARKGLACTRKYVFRSRKEKPEERFLLEFRRNSTSVDDGEIILYDNGDEWSDAYKQITREFYLRL
jgi:tRNA1Val (adenine37-N6)-methyltransferase